MQDFARLNATLGKMTIVDEVTAKIEMTFPVKDAQRNFMFLTSKQKQKVIVALGDPQMAMSFSEEEMLQPYAGRYFTADNSGVVTSIQRKDEDEDENQGDLFAQNEGEDSDGTKKEATGEEIAGDNPEEDADGEGAQEKPDEDSLEADKPEWMKESEDGEIDFESEEAGAGDGEPGAEESGDHQEKEDVQPAESSVDQEQAAEESDQGAAPEEVDKEELEKFILEHRPAYDDLPIDFPGLLEERLSSNTTWREIANKIGLTSGQFSARWSKYKERVAQQMRENGAA